MDKIENFLKLTLPTIVIVSLSYEVCYLWGLDINIAESPISNGDILRGWQQWHLLLSPLIILTIYPNFLLFLTDKFTKILTGNSRKKQSIVRATLILRRIAFGLSLVLISFYVMFGDVFQAFLILSFSVLLVDLSIKKIKTTPTEKTNIVIVTAILLISLFIGSFASIIGFYDKYKSFIHEDSYVEVEGYKKTVIRTYEHWTLVRYGLESYAWLHHQSDRKIITSTDKTHFLGAICHLKRNGYFDNSLTDIVCYPYVKIKDIDLDDDENCFLDSLKRDKSIRKDSFTKCLNKSIEDRKAH